MAKSESLKQIAARGAKQTEAFIQECEKRAKEYAGEGEHEKAQALLTLVSDHLRPLHKFELETAVEN